MSVIRLIPVTPVLNTIAGVSTDANFSNPVDGLFCVDTTHNKLYVSIGGVWKGVVVA